MFEILVKKDSIDINSDLEFTERKGVKFYYKGLPKGFIETNVSKFCIKDLISLLNNNELDNFLLIVNCKESKKVYVFNDHFGSQEIYYKKEDGLITASDNINSLKPSKDKISQEAIYEVVIFQTILPPDTIYSDVKSVPLASYAKFGFDTVDVQEYWNYDDLFQNKEYDYEKLIDEGRLSLLTSTRNNSNSNTSIALSGGIDSGGMLGMYKHEFPEDEPGVIAIGPYGKGSGDLVSARKSAEYNNLFLKEVYPVKEDISKLWEWSEGLPQPVCSTHIFIHALLFDEARKIGSDTMTFGLGAEMLLGNLKISRVKEKLWFENLLPNSIVKFSYSLFGKLITKSDTQTSFLLHVGDWTSRFMTARGPYYSWVGKYFKNEKVDFWNYCRDKMRSGYDDSLDIYDCFVKLYLKSWVNYLQFRDLIIIGKKFEVTPVIPFDSTRLTNIFFRVPNVHRKRNNWNKQLIRDIMKPFVADHLYSNPVKSLVIPFEEFLSGKEDEIINYVSGCDVTKNIFEYDLFMKNYKSLPEGGIVLMHIFGVAVWYDSNFSPERRDEFLKIFK